MKQNKHHHLNTPKCRSVLLTTSAALTLALAAGANEVKFTLQPNKAFSKLGYYMPQRLNLSAQKPDGVKTPPPGLQAPMYGEMKLGPAESPSTFFLIVDEPEGKPARLFVDANGDGDFTNDKPAEWNGSTRTNNGVTTTSYSGGGDFQVRYGADSLTLHLEAYRFDKNDPNRAGLKDALLYYRDYARSGKLELGGKTYDAMLVDESASGDFRTTGTNTPPTQLLIDLNANARFESNGEQFPINKPFNIGGTTYEVAGMTAAGDSFQIVKSAQTVEETKPIPDLSPGKAAVAFQAKTTAGDALDFPASYKGKVVLLDFWATWCGPCVAELPNVTAAYNKYHNQGFEVLGISLDKENAEEKLAKFTKEHSMPWPQIYDGKGWQAEVARKYFIDRIPQAFLIDGNTGNIIAAGFKAAGKNLPESIEKALAARK